MTIGDLAGYLKQHWPTIREQLLRQAVAKAQEYITSDSSYAP